MDLGYIKERTSFRYDINKSKEVKAMFIIRLLSLIFIYIFISTNRVLAAVSFLMTAEVPIL